MKFDFQIVIDQPEKFTFAVKDKINTEALLIPLQVGDEGKLSDFLTNLPIPTRIFFTLSSYDEIKARELCEAINRYDKLRFVVEEKRYMT